MKLRDIVGKGPIDLKRPSGVSDEQWAKAVSLYRAAENVGDKFPELTVAQAALETGWFKSESGKNNYFGQKASKSQEGSDVVTHEVIGGKRVKITDKFRNYDSIENALQDRKRKWMSKYDGASTAQEAIGSIWQFDENKNQGKGYATDPKYGEKLEKILGMMGVDSTRVKYSGKGLPTERTEVAIDNTAVRKPKFFTPSFNPGAPTYASIETEEKKESKPKQEGVSEDQVRKLLEQERKRNEQLFVNALSKNKQPEEDYSPQYQLEDSSHLYNYINLQD